MWYPKGQKDKVPSDCVRAFAIATAMLIKPALQMIPFLFAQDYVLCVRSVIKYSQSSTIKTSKLINILYNIL